jgi:hypothetical protein
MTGRRSLLAVVLTLLAVPALAQQAAERANATPSPRRPAPRRRPPPPPPPAPVATPRGDPAPVPDRDVEGPRRLETVRPTPRLDPALIDPAEPRFGTDTDRNSLQAREDRLLRQPAAGARLRLPFTY